MKLAILAALAAASLALGTASASADCFRDNGMRCDDDRRFSFRFDVDRDRFHHDVDRDRDRFFFHRGDRDRFFFDRDRGHGMY